MTSINERSTQQLVQLLFWLQFFCCWLLPTATNYLSIHQLVGNLLSQGDLWFDLSLWEFLNKVKVFFLLQIMKDKFKTTKKKNYQQYKGQININIFRTINIKIFLLFHFTFLLVAKIVMVVFIATLTTFCLLWLLQLPEGWRLLRTHFV